MKKKVTRENLSILIADDVKSMRSIVRSMLKNLNIGQTPLMAENGLDGLRLMHANRIDLAIIDWKMPIMTGAQMLEAIRADKHLRDTPVLMVTAESERDIVLEAAEIEVDAYLLKPLTPAILEEKIMGLIDQMNQPDKATLHVRKARQLEENMDFPTAIRHMEAAVQLKPGASRLLRKLGLLHQKNKAPEKMEKFLLKAASVNAQDAVTRYLLGEFYRKEKNLLKAACYYHETIDLTRKFSDDAVLLAEELLGERYSKDAKALFSGVIAKSPKNIEMIERIIDICIEYGELHFCLTLLKKVLHDFPSNYDLIYQAGIVCEMMEDEDAALDYFINVDHNQFNRIDVKLKIAKIYHRKNKVIQADNYLNSILRIDPDNEEAFQLKRQL